MNWFVKLSFFLSSLFFVFFAENEKLYANESRVIDCTLVLKTIAKPAGLDIQGFLLAEKRNNENLDDPISGDESNILIDGDDMRSLPAEAKVRHMISLPVTAKAIGPFNLHFEGLLSLEGPELPLAIPRPELFSVHSHLDPRNSQSFELDLFNTTMVHATRFELPYRLPPDLVEAITLMRQALQEHFDFASVQARYSSQPESFEAYSERVSIELDRNIYGYIGSPSPISREELVSSILRFSRGLERLETLFADSLPSGGRFRFWKHRAYNLSIEKLMGQSPGWQSRSDDLFIIEFPTTIGRTYRIIFDCRPPALH